MLPQDLIFFISFLFLFIIIQGMFSPQHRCSFFPVPPSNLTFMINELIAQGAVLALIPRAQFLEGWGAQNANQCH